MARIDGHIFLSDLYRECKCNKGLKVEINYDGNYVGAINSIGLKGDYMCILEDCKKEGMNTDKIVDGLSKLDYNFDKQLFVINGDKVFIVTSIDHIEFEDFNLIELYAEQIN